MAPELSDEKIVEYDSQGTISLTGVLITAFFVFAGFAFTAIMLVVTSVEPITPLSQVILFIFFISMEGLVLAAWMLFYLNLDISMDSPKPIIPIYPTQWPIINAFSVLSISGISIAITLTFLLRNLVMLFVVSIIAYVVGLIFLSQYWGPVAQKMHKKGILK
ncbi:MAG: hypothetical protein ACXV5N_12645 [Halobacteriota archaeon]